MTESTSSETNSYDQLPYDSHPYKLTHPDHLAVMAKLFGLESPTPANARVLEIGCAAGGNLIPMAVSLPDSHFLGFDLSQKELQEGIELAEKLQLKNVEFEHCDILNFDRPGEEFDYIICHGVFSWIPAEARRRIFEICERHLSENGVAYISYNTYPGWHMRGMVRQMMCFHARQFEDPETQVAQARALLDFVNKAAGNYDPTYQMLLQREVEIVQHRQDSYLFHEHLEKDNEPLFFYQFMEQAAEHELRYLGETQFSEMVPSQFAPEVSETLQKLCTDIIHAEQYLDFLRNRTFRRTLLCRADRQLERQLGEVQLKGMFVRSPLKLANEQMPLSQPGNQAFSSPSGLTATIASPLLKQGLAVLCSKYPEYVKFDDLPQLIHTGDGPFVRNKAGLESDYAELAAMLLQLLSQDLVEFRTAPVRHATQIPTSASTTTLVRHQMEDGDYVTNLRHEMIELNDMDRHLLRCVDRDDAARLQYFRELIATEELVVSAVDNSGNGDVNDEQLQQLIQHGMNRLVERALLIEAE